MTPPAGKYNAFIKKLVDLENEAGQLGMWKTMHALNAAKQAAGWEEADRRKQEDKK